APPRRQHSSSIDTSRMIQALQAAMRPFADAASGPTDDFADTLEASKAAIAQALRDAKNGSAGAAQPAAAPAGAEPMQLDGGNDAELRARLAATTQRATEAERRAAELEKRLAAERKAREAAERKTRDADACTVAERKRADDLEEELRIADRGNLALQSKFAEERKARRAAEKALREVQRRPASTSLLAQSSARALAAAPQRAVPRPAPLRRSPSRERTPPPPPRAGPAELGGKRKPPNSANPPTPDPGQPPATVEFDFTETFDGGGPAGEAERRGSDQ
ncbi:unnamed protein product, partial [Pelagomonas calceolata]